MKKQGRLIVRGWLCWYRGCPKKLVTSHEEKASWHKRAEEDKTGRLKIVRVEVREEPKAQSAKGEKHGL